MADRDKTIHRKAKGYRWEGVKELPYKEDDRALFKSVTRQVLFADPQAPMRIRAQLAGELAARGYADVDDVYAVTHRDSLSTTTTK